MADSVWSNSTTRYKHYEQTGLSAYAIGDGVAAVPLAAITLVELPIKAVPDFDFSPAGNWTVVANVLTCVHPGVYSISATVACVQTEDGEMNIETYIKLVTNFGTLNEAVLSKNKVYGGATAAFATDEVILPLSFTVYVPAGATIKLFAESRTKAECTMANTEIYILKIV